ncbi:hypothetical protein OG978_17015 [Streptomyces sp. NBC_01591]|uniref:hypothetical protein n=1 Tax=Streptomyces sp. NBC_01591 TaxID=2975888 RepID=UPI002DD90BBB|nr:hypothetical protein [Streptomyces sp. NBC_01591]WSD68953.1 hypothetical protein OG978_17015 [Streptomyces sp. NBC_01591]
MDDTHDIPTHDIAADIRALRAALAVHGITLPSLGVDPLTLAGWTSRPPLVALGNCNAATARRMAEVLRSAAGG